MQWVCTVHSQNLDQTAGSWKNLPPLRESVSQLGKKKKRLRETKKLTQVTQQIRGRVPTSSSTTPHTFLGRPVED